MTDIGLLRIMADDCEAVDCLIHAATIRDAVAEIERLRTQNVGADVGSAAARDVLAERRRQVEAEGWTPEHDDIHGEGEIADAAACYAAGSIPMAPVARSADRFVPLWPWSRKWWKPSDRRRNLVKSGALILAEIERLDRLGARVSVGANVGYAPTA